MKFKEHGVALISVSLIALGAWGCKGQRSNTNAQGTPATAPQPARWVAQYRSPDSVQYGYGGVNLAWFFYSGISVVSQNVVFVCGDVPKSKSGEERVAVIVRTTDGGQNWTETQIELPGIAIPTLNSIHFINADVGWAVGADSGQKGVVLKTTNGGSTWTATRIAHKQVPTTVFFTDADTGWIGGATPPPGEDEGVGGPSTILSTTDGGATWREQYNVPISVYRVFFIDKANGWASGSKGAIYRTTDAGRTWETMRTEIEMSDGPVDLKGEGVKQFAIRGLHFPDKDNGFAAATATEEEVGGRMLGTNNAGVTWRRVWIVKGSGVHDVFFVNKDEGWGLTDGGPYVYHTVDGGRSWLSEPKVFEQDVQLSRLGAADSTHVWAVGGGGIFYRVTE